MIDTPDTPRMMVGIEISEDSLHVVRLDDQGSLLEASHDATHAGEGSPRQLIELVGELKERVGGLASVGIAVPGLVSQDKMRVAYSARLPEHAAIDIKDEIMKATGVTVLIENDANAAAYGEFKKGSGRGSSHLFYVTLGKGVGGALIIDGMIWRGAAGFAGEFGYLTINSEGLRLEDVASEENIVRRTRSRFNRDSTSSLNRFEEQQINLEQIVAAAENGDDFAQLMLERTGNYIGTGVASVINLLNIETIVVGGEIMDKGHLVLDSIVKRARELSFRPSFAKTTIVGGQLGQNSAAIGAALLANGI
ncbi:MAG: ROK family protein [Pyrinomonadaceae bacterium]